MENVPINFWSRLEMFVKNVEVNDPMAEEEKEMILRIAGEQKDSSPIKGETAEASKLVELIAKVHDDIEGRYDLDSFDKGCIEHYLCKLQPPSNVDRSAEDTLKAHGIVIEFTASLGEHTVHPCRLSQLLSAMEDYRRLSSKEDNAKLAFEFSAWCWGKVMPTEVSDIEKFFLRFLEDRRRRTSPPKEE